jgi:hypothetical protein
MDSKAGVRQFAFLLIEQIPKGRKIVLRELFKKIEDALPKQGDRPTEPRFENDIRFAIQDAKDRGLIKQSRRPGEWQRT